MSRLLPCDHIICKYIHALHQTISNEVHIHCDAYRPTTYVIAAQKMILNDKSILQFYVLCQ